MSMSQPLDPLHGGPTRGIPSVTVLRKTVNPSVVDLKSRADAPTPGQMSVIVCQANDDHPQEDDHYLENDQVAPEISTGSEPSTTVFVRSLDIHTRVSSFLREQNCFAGIEVFGGIRSLYCVGFTHVELSD